MSIESRTLSFRRGHRTYRFTPNNLIGAHVTPGNICALDSALETATKEGFCEVRPPQVEPPNVEPPKEKDTLLLAHSGDPEDFIDALNKLLTNDFIEWAGPLVIDEDSARKGSTLAYLTREILVVIQPPADAEQVLMHAESLGYDVLRVIPYGPPKTWHLRAAKHPGYGLLDHCAELMRIEGVVAEPNLAGSASPDTDVSESSQHDLWDRKKIGVENAWKRAKLAKHSNLDVTLAVVDGSFTPSEVKPDQYLREYLCFDLRCLENNKDNRGASDPCELFDKNASGHGLRAAGVAATVRERGVWGSAPGCRVRTVIYPATELDVLDMYAWLAGVNPGSPRPGFPAMLNKPADVVTTSVGFGFAKRMPPSFLADHTFNLIALKGRGGKGTLLFFSAGNDDGIASLERPWATVEKNFGIAASTPDSSGEMRRAPYSNHHGVELCAPSSDTDKATGRSTRTVCSIESTTFGGTSAATPLAAGVAVLILQVRPDLRHDSVRRILRKTATRIDPDAKDENTLWRDADKAPLRSSAETRIYSHAYGFGQVNAAAAVRDALTFVQQARIIEPTILSWSEFKVQNGAFPSQFGCTPCAQCRCRPFGGGPFGDGPIKDDPDELAQPPKEVPDRAGYTALNANDVLSLNQSMGVEYSGLSSSKTKTELRDLTTADTKTKKPYTVIHATDDQPVEDDILKVHINISGLKPKAYELVVLDENEKVIQRNKVQVKRDMP